MSEGANLDRGSPTGVHRYPPRIARQTRGGRSAMRGSPLWTPWTTRSVSGRMAINPRGQFLLSPGGQFRMSFDTGLHSAGIRTRWERMGNHQPF